MLLRVRDNGGKDPPRQLLVQHAPSSALPPSTLMTLAKPRHLLGPRQQSVRSSFLAWSGMAAVSRRSLLNLGINLGLNQRFSLLLLALRRRLCRHRMLYLYDLHRIHRHIV